MMILFPTLILLVSLVGLSLASRFMAGLLPSVTRQVRLAACLLAFVASFLPQLGQCSTEPFLVSAAFLLPWQSASLGFCLLGSLVPFFHHRLGEDHFNRLFTLWLLAVLAGVFTHALLVLVCVTGMMVLAQQGPKRDASSGRLSLLSFGLLGGLLLLLLAYQGTMDLSSLAHHDLVHPLRRHLVLLVVLVSWLLMMVWPFALVRSEGKTQRLWGSFAALAFQLSGAVILSALWSPLLGHQLGGFRESLPWIWLGLWFVTVFSRWILQRPWHDLIWSVMPLQVGILVMGPNLGLQSVKPALFSLLLATLAWVTFRERQVKEEKATAEEQGTKEGWTQDRLLAVFMLVSLLGLLPTGALWRIGGSGWSSSPYLLVVFLGLQAGVSIGLLRYVATHSLEASGFWQRLWLVLLAGILCLIACFP